MRDRRYVRNIILSSSYRNLPSVFDRILMRYYVHLISKPPGEISFSRLIASALRRRYYALPCVERIRFLSATTVFLHDRVLHPELSWDGIRERLSSRTLDRAVRAPGCSRAVSKWISRSHEYESTVYHRAEMPAERACTPGFSV